MQTIPCINTIFFLRTLFQKNDRSVDIFTYKSGSEVVPFSPKEGDQDNPMIHRYLFAGVYFLVCVRPCFVTVSRHLLPIINYQMKVVEVTLCVDL